MWVLETTHRGLLVQAGFSRPGSGGRTEGRGEVLSFSKAAAAGGLGFPDCF